MAAANHGDLCGEMCKKTADFRRFLCFFCAPPPGRVSFWRRVVIGGVDGGTGRFCWAWAYFCCFILCRDDKNDGCQVYGKYRANYKKFVDVATDVCAMILCLLCDLLLCAPV